VAADFNNASILEIDPTSGTVVGSPYSDKSLNGPSGYRHPLVGAL